MITANSNFTHDVEYLVHWPRQTLSLCNHTFDFTSNIIECLPRCKIIGTDFEIFHVAYIVIRYYNLCICVRHLFSMQLGYFCQKQEWDEVLPFGMQNTIHTYIHTYTHTHTYIYIHTHTHTYIHTYIHIHTYTHTYINTHIYTHTYTHTYIHIYTHTQIHTYTYIHTYIHIYIHTYIHTYYTSIFPLDSQSFRFQTIGAFAKLRKATISFVMSVCLSVRPSLRME